MWGFIGYRFTYEEDHPPETVVHQPNQHNRRARGGPLFVFKIKILQILRVSLVISRWVLISQKHQLIYFRNRGKKNDAHKTSPSLDFLKLF